MRVTGMSGHAMHLHRQAKKSPHKAGHSVVHVVQFNQSNMVANVTMIVKTIINASTPKTIAISVTPMV
jgi:hypothetical protein